MDHANESILSVTIEGLDVGVVAIDPHGVVRYVNPAAARFGEVSAADWLGRALPANAPGWLSETSSAELRLAIIERRALRLCELPPHREQILETLLCPGSAGSMIWVAQDVRTSAEASLTHDLMQPLGSISNYAELIGLQGEEVTRRHAKEISRIVAALAARIRRSAT